MPDLTLKDISANISVAFKQRVATLIGIGTKGTVLMVKQYEDLTSGLEYRVTNFKSAVFELTSDYGADFADIETKIKQTLNGGAKEVILLEYPDTFADVASVITDVLKWDWILSLESGDQSDVAAIAKEQQKFGLVYNLASDSIYVASVNNPSAVLANDTIGGSAVITGLDLLPIVGGVIAGCPYTKSISYKIFTELTSVTLPTTIAYGQITLYNEEEGVRVASPVNTLTSTDDTYTEDMKSITIAEGMQRIKTDMIHAFRTGYKGKYKNDYDHQALFLGAAQYYLNQLEQLGILDPNYDNKIDIDIEAQRALWIAQGKTEAETWDDMTVKKMTYKNEFLPLIDCKLLDAIEGMTMTVEMF